MSLVPAGYAPRSQTDKQWKDTKYGNGQYTIGVAGCALTALTNVINILTGSRFTPPEVDRVLKTLPKEHPGYSGAQLYWANVPYAFPQLKFVFRDWNYSNVLVASYVYVLKTPVIVAVKTAFSPQHFVTYIGDTLMIDSQDGKIKSTDFYPTRTGSVRFLKK